MKNLGLATWVIALSILAGCGSTEKSVSPSTPAAAPADKAPPPPTDSHGMKDGQKMDGKEMK